METPMSDLSSPAILPSDPSVFNPRFRNTPLSEKLDHEMSTTVRREGCLITLRAVDRDGYRSIWHAGKRRRLHRMMLERKIGRPLQANKHTRHLCNQPGCINPDHLLEGSAHENYMDRIQSGTQTKKQHRGEYARWTKLSENDVQQIRTEYASGNTTYRKLATKYSVHRGTIDHVINRRTWNHV